MLYGALPACPTKVGAYRLVEKFISPGTCAFIVDTITGFLKLKCQKPKIIFTDCKLYFIALLPVCDKYEGVS